MRFAIKGLGYVAPRHVEAIKKIGGDLIGACDPHTNVGFLDSYFPACQYFKNDSDFNDWLEYTKPEYYVICTPNYLHTFDIETAAESGIKAIVEKPLVINQAEYKKVLSYNIPVYPILQLRNNLEIIALRKNKPEHAEIDIVYHTYRGPWYNQTWHMSNQQSGGLVYNIGIHLFDILAHIFGDYIKCEISKAGARFLTGTLYLTDAIVNIDLCLLDTGLNRSMRTITINGTKTIDMTDNFTDLHTITYQRIISGDWCTAQDITKTMEIIENVTKEAGCYR